MLSDHLLAAAVRQTSTENVQSGGEVSGAARVSIQIDPFIEPNTSRTKSLMTFRSVWTQTLLPLSMGADVDGRKAFMSSSRGPFFMSSSSLKP